MDKNVSTFEPNANSTVVNGSLPQEIDSGTKERKKCIHSGFDRTTIETIKKSRAARVINIIIYYIYIIYIIIRGPTECWLVRNSDMSYNFGQKYGRFVYFRISYLISLLNFSIRNLRYYDLNSIYKEDNTNEKLAKFLLSLSQGS